MISKRLLFINILILILILSVYVFGFSLLNYSMRFDFWYCLKECNLQYLILALVFITLISWLISTLKIKNLNSKNKFLLVYAILCSLLLCYFTYTALSSYIKEKKAITTLENEYIKQAKKDIKNDNVTFRFAGGFEIPMYDNQTLKMIDSIRKNYGVSYQNTGCVIDNIDIEAQKKYDEIVKIYLEKRNGKGWENKMRKEIEKVQNNSIHSK
ncbi:hypothetical protein [Chryseobacterium sp. MMS23-Vi53]|uniref:FEKKY domain-containing protein n=1 Tax=Chryseobacterium sp. MMS23-Vi53 TaxID=3386644 RepID=UPI0039E86CB8